MEVLDAFRLAMRRLAATVTVITAFEDGQPKGMAATAVCSLSFDPPSVLACINRRASLHRLLVAAERFGVNVLSKSQGHIAQRFADPAFREARFAEVNWHAHRGVPMIVGAQATLICRQGALFDHGSHSILVGNVHDVELTGDVAPLVYCDGGFGAD